MDKLKLPRKMVLIIGVLFFLIFVFVLLKSCGSDSSGEISMDAIPHTPTPDADSPADTIKTLTASVSALLDDVRALRRDNQELRENNQLLIDRTVRLERDVTSQLQRELKSRSASESRTIGQQTKHLERLEKRLDDLSDSLVDDRRRYAITAGRPSADTGASSSEFEWTSPLANSSQTVDQTLRAEPVYTIPKNATLVGSTTLTALIGRVPVEDRVRDPLPFKVITGNHNLASNGHRIPNLHGTVWSGYAVGDWTLSCVSGTLNSVTFIFNDGTIRTLDGTDEKQRLGWITDAYGVPCLRGKKVSNFTPLLAAHLATGAVTGAANAAALAETEQTSNALGGISSNITGDITKFMVGKSIAHSSQSVSSWLSARSQQEFDAVVVLAGQDVVLQVDAELHIDYQASGRKIAYENYEDSNYLPLD